MSGDAFKPALSTATDRSTFDATGLRVPALNTPFVVRWSPARVAVFGLVAYALLVLLSPLEYDTSVVTLGGALFALAAYAAFFSGCYVAQIFNSWSGQPAPQATTLAPDIAINITAAIGGLGVAARIYDRITRGFVISQTYTETRESLTGSVSIFGYVGGLFFTFGFVALALFWLSKSERRRPLMYVVVVALSVYPLLESLLQGSRSTLFNTAIFVFLLARSANALGWITRSWATLLATGVLLLLFSQVLYERRSLEGTAEVDIADIYKTTAISAYARPQDWVIQDLVATNGEGPVAAIEKVWVHFTQYATHSWLVFFINFERFDGTAAWGGLHLFLPARAIAAVSGYDLVYDAYLHGAEEGIFSSALSGLYYEFGGFGPLFAALFGLIVTLIHGRTIRHPERWLPLNAYLCYACGNALIDDALVGGLGQFAIIAFTAYVPLHYLIEIISGSSSKMSAIASLHVPMIGSVERSDTPAAD